MGSSSDFSSPLPVSEPIVEPGSAPEGSTSNQDARLFSGTESASSTATRVTALPPYSETPLQIPEMEHSDMDSLASLISTTLTVSGMMDIPEVADEDEDQEILKKFIADNKIDRAERERAFVERMQRRHELPGLSAAEAKYRVAQLKRDENAATAEPRRSAAGLFKAVCSTDLLFLIDTTGSMGALLNAAKEQVKSIVNDIKLAFLNEAEVRVAVVGYKDHKDKLNIQFLDFTVSSERVFTFLSTLQASGGGDTPEDVLGGIQRALNASWRQQTRCIIHIADAPPHGRTNHDLFETPHAVDNFPEPGSEPHHLTYEPLLKQMVGLKINYAFLRINGLTDRMAFNFFQVYKAAFADCRLFKTNKYYAQSCELQSNGRSGSRRGPRSGLLFEEAALGTTYSALRHLVVKSVTGSASRTAVRASTSLARSTKSGFAKKLDLAAIEEGEDDDDDGKMDSNAPQWNNLGWFNETLVLEGFSPEIVVHGASTLNEMMAHDDNIAMSITELTIHKRSKPFAQGALRIASYARTAGSTNPFVVKAFKKNGKRLAHLAEDMRCQALCKAFALEFNALSGEEEPIDFIVTTCLKSKSKKAPASEFLSLEPYIEGKYVKYNNNCGHINDSIPDDRFNQAAQAFSHFTFERSQGNFLVTDLQGVGHLLTDPAIHTSDPARFRLADTNLGKEGFKFFFSSHVCNSICSKLELKSNASMLISGKFDFRQDWPTLSLTVCCSNKLCGKIVRLSSAKESSQFLGYHWCDACWAQLKSSTKKLACVGPGPAHEFEVCEFFNESQGRKTLRTCPQHTTNEVPDGAEYVGEGFWFCLKSAVKTLIPFA